MERIAFVGLGTMGAAMAANLRRAGFAVTGWNRSAGRGDDLAGLGGSVAASAAEAARAADVVVVCVSDTPDVEAVLFGADGVAEGLRGGGLVIDCSTISPVGHRASSPAACASAASASSTRRCPAARRAPARRP